MDYLPGSEAPEDGVYEEFNIFGTSTGITERVDKGERLPLAPRGYTWRKVSLDGVLPHAATNQPPLALAGRPSAKTRISNERHPPRRTGAR